MAPPKNDENGSDQDPNEQAETERLKKGELDEDVARRYDPARLSKLFSKAIVGLGSIEPVDAGVRAEVEKRTGADLSQARVVRGPLAEAMTRRHRAEALTIGGTNLILAKEAPRTPQKKLMAHELTHVAQQQRGMHFLKSEGAHNSMYEHEAERVAESVFKEESAANSGPDLQAQAADIERKVKARALELIAESARLRGERNGDG